MTKKSLLIYKLTAVIVVAIIVNVSVNYGNWYLPVISLITAWALLYILSGKVKEVIADERDHRIAGKASAWAIRIYAIPSVVIGLILYIAERENQILFTAGSVLLYSACFLVFIYAILFKIYERKSEHY